MPHLNIRSPQLEFLYILNVFLSLMSKPLVTQVSTPLNENVEIWPKCGHCYFSALPWLSWAWSSLEHHRLPLQSSSISPWRHQRAARIQVDLQSWWMLEILHSSTFCLRMLHRFSIGFKSTDTLGQFIPFILSFMLLLLSSHSTCPRKATFSMFLSNPFTFPRQKEALDPL